MSAPRNSKSDFRLVLAALISILCICPVQGKSVAPLPPQPETVASKGLRIYHVPRQDLPRAPGYAADGVYLPLSEIVRLADGAGTTGTVVDAEPRRASCSVESIVLSGTLTREALELQGTLHFAAQGSGWCASLVDDGRMNWLSVAGKAGTEAFLVRVNERTFLIARAGNAGVLHVRALVPVSLEQLEARIEFGRFYAPARIEIAASSNMETLSSTAPLDREASGMQSILRSWPTQGQVTMLRLRREATMQAPSTLRVLLMRTISPAGRTLTISDRLQLQDRFASGTTLSLPLPQDLQLLSADTTASARIAVTSESLNLTMEESATNIAVRAIFQTRHDAADATSAPVHRINGWSLNAVAQFNRLTLRTQEQLVPLAVPLPARVYPIPGTQHESRYECVGPLPAMEVTIAPLSPPVPLRVAATANISSREATIQHEVRDITKQQNDLLVTIPSEWVLTEADWNAADSTSGTCVVQMHSSRNFRLVWDREIHPEVVRFGLHRVGPWGAPGSSVELPAPIVQLNGQVPSLYEMHVTWPNELEVRATELQEMKIIPVHNSSSQAAASAAVTPRLSLRVIGNAAAGNLQVKAHASDIQGTVVTSFSVDEEQAMIRALLRFDVRFAPAHTFRFSLPKGTGGGVRVQGEGIRESLHRQSATGDEWTVITQNAILGPYDITLEWPLPDKPVGRPLKVPEIRLTGVSAQRGFVILQGSSALRLTAETQSLTEADPSEVPGTPWDKDNRTLAVYRYIEPPYSLKVQAEKFVPEPILESLVREAELLTTIAPEGERLTRARYSVTPISDRQFFELRLPRGAQLWSTMVNSAGVKPARRASSGEEPFLLVPLPVSAAGTDVDVSLVYREEGRALSKATKVQLTGPRVEAPVNRTIWNLTLPRGFEYLAYGGSFMEETVVREPLVTFLRTAYYPERLVLEDWSVKAIIFLTAFFLLVGSVILRRKRSRTIDGQMYSVASEVEPARSGCLGRFAGLLIVIGIIAILSAIAVPNFLEAQDRAKVSRVKSDQRSLATAIEGYYVDNNQYPHDASILWQGAVKYANSGFTDPYAAEYGSALPLQYIQGEKAWEKAVAAGYVSPDEPKTPYFWLTYSVGPDGKDDGALITYDPTNGTVSGGDVIRTKQGPNPIQPRYKEVAAKEHRAARAEKTGAYGPTLEKGNEAEVPQQVAQSESVPEAKAPQSQAAPIGKIPDIQVGDAEIPADAKDKNAFLFSDKFKFSDKVEEQKPAENLPGLPAAPPPPGSPRKAEGVADSVSAGRTHFYRDSVSNAGDDGLATDSPARGGAKSTSGTRRSLVAAPPARQAGLLSLGIQVPEGRLQRRFEALSGDARLDIRLLESRQFEQIRFCIWMGSLLLLTLCWFISRQTYRIVFLVAAGITLLVPILIANTWTAFFNSAFQGVLFSLIIPVLNRGILRFFHDGAKPAAIVALLLLFAGPVSSHAGEAPVPVTTALVPYDGNDTMTTAADPLAFISRAAFTKLWNESQTGPGTERLTTAALSSLEISGRFLPEQSRITGTLIVRAINPGDTPATIPLQLAGISLSSATFSAPGAGVAREAGSLLIQLQPHWFGEMKASFEFIVQGTGVSGTLRTEIPEVATGAWEMTLPFAQAEVRSALPFITEKHSSTTLLRGATRPGAFELTWTADAKVREKLADGSLDGLRAEVNTIITWNNLSAGSWNSEVTFRTDDNSLLPNELRMEIPPSLHIINAEGEKLESAEVSGNILHLRLTDAASAAVKLRGLLTSGTLSSRDATSSADTANSAWHAASLRFPSSVKSHETLVVRLAKEIELVSAESETLQRRSEQQSLPGYSQLQYDGTGNHWQLSLLLRRFRSEHAVNISELFVPADGILRHAAHIEISPRASPLVELMLDMPAGMNVRTLTGDGTPRWVQHKGAVRVAFEAPVAKPFNLKLTADSELTSAASVTLVPVIVRGSTEGTRTAAVLVDAGVEIVEREMNMANPRAPDERETSLAETLQAGQLLEDSIMRAYTLSSALPISIRLEPVESRAMVSVFNKVTFSEGLQTLDALVRAEPKRGRLHEVEVLLVSGISDPAISSRIRSSGPVRHLRSEQLDDETVRVVVELSEPHKSTVLFNLQIEQPAQLTDKHSVPATVVRPIHPGIGGRAYVLVRRALEGDLSIADARGSQNLDPRELKRLDWEIKTEPSDIALDISVASGNPSFQITRHARQEALRAVVEVLRQRTIISSDGFRRNELEIALQNQSEQFLKIAMPYARSETSIYEVQVAGRPIKPAFLREGERDVLLVPLIRTGLLEPELTVRVVYTVKGHASLRGSGRIAEELPDILGGIPVAQSALVLMLPGDYRYSDYSGTLNRVELVDLEIDEAVRQTRAVEKLSEAALHTKGDTQKKALSALSSYKSKVSSRIQSAKMQSEAYSRANSRQDESRDQKADRAREVRLAGERAVNLQAASKAEENIISNVRQLDELVQVQESQQQQQTISNASVPALMSQLSPAPSVSSTAAVTPPAPAVQAPAIAFPRSGQVLVFRQLQGTGDISFRYVSRAWFAKLYDIATGAALLTFLGLAMFSPWRLFASASRFAFLVLVVSLAAIAFGVALDISIPLFAVAAFYLIAKRRRVTASLE